MTSGSTLEKPQEQGRLGRLCGAALIRCCGGDKTSDSLIDGLADITIPCESTEWPMPGPHFWTAGRGAEPPTMQPEWGSHRGGMVEVAVEVGAGGVMKGTICILHFANLL